jgi:5-methylcytosine-specific restriction endonuclease McrA
MTNTGPNEYVVNAALERANHCCERCGRPRPEQIHHRKPRGAGGTSDPKINVLSNLLVLCSACHVEVESDRAVAYEQGWLVRRNADPAKTRVWLAFRGFSWLSDDGAVEVE